MFRKSSPSPDEDLFSVPEVARTIEESKVLMVGVVVDSLIDNPHSPGVLG